MIQSRWIRRVVALTAVLCLVSSLAYAAEATVETSAEPKHEGIHLRMSVGSGFSYFSTWFPSHKFTMMGATILPELHLGFSAIENLIISGGLSGSFLVEPDLKSTVLGESHSTGSGVTAVNAGLGIMYFFMPYHIFLGGQVNASYATFKIDGDTIGTDAYNAISRHRLGFSTGIQFGKQWWVTDHSSLGLGLNYLFYLYPREMPSDLAETIRKDTVIWFGHTVGLAVTATYH